jgi:PAS domain S-box-containing protein
MFFTLDPHGTILSANKLGAKRMGYYGMAELIGRPWYVLFRRQDKKSLHECLVAYVNEPDTVCRWEECKLRKNGQSLWTRKAHARWPTLKAAPRY